jgi:hypothetical protein
MSLCANEQKANGPNSETSKVETKRETGRSAKAFHATKTHPTTKTT